MLRHIHKIIRQKISRAFPQRDELIIYFSHNINYRTYLQTDRKCFNKFKTSSSTRWWTAARMVLYWMAFEQTETQCLYGNLVSTTFVLVQWDVLTVLHCQASLCMADKWDGENSCFVAEHYHKSLSVLSNPLYKLLHRWLD